MASALNMSSWNGRVRTRINRVWGLKLFKSLFRLTQSRWHNSSRLASFASILLTFFLLVTGLRVIFVRYLFNQQSRPRVFIWTPGGPCTGIFASDAAEHSRSHFPYVVIRDAVVDRRPVSLKHVREVHTEKNGLPFIRIVVYLSVHLSAFLSTENSLADIVSSTNEPLPFQAFIDYVTRADPFLISYREYRPGRLNSKRKEISEWQMGITIFPENYTGDGDMEEFIESVLEASMASDPATLKMILNVRRFDNKKIAFAPSMSLACAVGWLHRNNYPPIHQLMGSPKCVKSPSDLNASVVISGSALYGSKNRESQHFREVAHFAARSLYGPVAFDTVVMTVVVNETIGGIAHRCGNSTKCVSDLTARNKRQLEHIREVVEEELDTLNVPRLKMPQVLLVPSCRLGSHAWGSTEMFAPCRGCHMYGQYHATFFPYTLVSGFYKWSMLHDMDEVVMDDPRHNKWLVRSGNASNIFDREDRLHKGFLSFTWLHFLNSENVTEMLTRDIMNGVAPKLVTTPGSSKSLSELLSTRRDPTGKCAVRCDVGLGFTIHASVVRASPRGSRELSGMQVHQFARSMRTWHARLKYSRTNLTSVHMNM